MSSSKYDERAKSGAIEPEVDKQVKVNSVINWQCFIHFTVLKLA